MKRRIIQKSQLLEIPENKLKERRVELVSDTTQLKLLLLMEKRLTDTLDSNGVIDYKAQQ